MMIWLRKVVVVLCLILIGELQVFAGSFTDVNNESSRSKAIEYLKKMKIIEGYSDGTFKPLNTINRAEALKMLMEARWKLMDRNVGNGVNFSDIKKSDWFYEFVSQASKLGIVQGYGDGTFKPERSISRAESLKIVMEGLEIEILGNSGGEGFSDVERGSWYEKYVNEGLEKQLIDLDETKLFRPNEAITREDFAEMIFRAVYMKTNKLEKFPISVTWNGINFVEGRMNLRVPKNWRKEIFGDKLFLIKGDLNNGKKIDFRVWPEGGLMVFQTVKKSELGNMEDYANKLLFYPHIKKQSSIINGMNLIMVLDSVRGVVDYFLELNDEDVLIILTESGRDERAKVTIEEIRYIVGSVRSGRNDEYEDLVDETSSNIEENQEGDENLASKIREFVLIEGKSNDALEIVADEILIETDTIGVGMGPVDYWFSKNALVTVKIDRNSRTVLGVMNGKSSQF